MKLEGALNDATDLKQQLELKAQENKGLSGSLESLRTSHAELEVRDQRSAPMRHVPRGQLTSISSPLQRAFQITAAGVEGGKSLAESAKDMERVRKTIASQLQEFDAMKKSLMRDLQNRCEKVSEACPNSLSCVGEHSLFCDRLQVVELEISLDETQEQYKNVLKNSNSKAQQRKMDFLTRNLDQLTLVQKQVRLYTRRAAVMTRSSLMCSSPAC